MKLNQMELYHREIIRKNIDVLVKETDLDSVRESLLQKGVFNKRMVEPFENKLRNKSDRIQEMYFYLKTRGPDAFSHLIETLMETGHLELARQLDPNCNPETYLTQLYSSRIDGHSGTNDDQNDSTSSSRRCHPSILPQYMVNQNSEVFSPLALRETPRTSLINIGTEPRKIVVTKATIRLDKSHNQPDVLVYPMGSSPKGLVLLINNVEFASGMHTLREGAKVDETNLKELFTQLGYKIISFHNLGVQDMRNRIKEFSKHKDLFHVCSLVVVIMSHGNRGHQNNSNIIGSDGHDLDTLWILNQFNSENCPAMIKKPKIFFFQVCDGKSFDFGVQVSDDRKRTETDGLDINARVRSMADMLVANSTLPGYVSHRDVYLGTWYIQAICEVFMEHAWNKNIEDMLKIVDSRLSVLMSEERSLQTSRYQNIGFQTFYFNPGLYDESEMDILLSNTTPTSINETSTTLTGNTSNSTI